MNRIAEILTILLIMMVGCGGNNQSSDNFIPVDVTANYPKKRAYFTGLYGCGVYTVGDDR